MCNTKIKMYFIIWKDRTGQFRTTLKAANHETIVTTEGYINRASAENAIRLIRQANALTPVQDRT